MNIHIVIYIYDACDIVRLFRTEIAATKWFKLKYKKLYRYEEYQFWNIIKFSVHFIKTSILVTTNWSYLWNFLLKNPTSARLIVVFILIRF